MSSESLYTSNKSSYKILNGLIDSTTDTIDQDGGASRGSDKKSKKSKQDLEIEYRFYDVDTQKIRKQLRKLGAERVHKAMVMPLMTFTHPTGKKDSYIRIRHEGAKVTMTSKTDLNNKFVTEYEVDISSFGQGVKLLMSLGCKKKYYVEKIREKWNVMNTELVIDSYPGTPEYIEIESKKEKDIKNVVENLGLDKPVKHKDIYTEVYGVPANRKVEGDLTIDNVVEKMGKLVTKNKKQFIEIVKAQKKFYKKPDRTEMIENFSEDERYK